MKTLSELISEFIQQSNQIQENVNKIESLKEEIQNAISKEQITELINENPYLKSQDFNSKVASEIDLNALSQSLPKDELKANLKELFPQVFSPQDVYNLVNEDENFKSYLDTKVSLESSKAVSKTLLLYEFKKQLRSEIASLTYEALQDNKIDKYRMEGALTLFIIRLYSKLIIMEDTRNSLARFNIYKRI